MLESVILDESYRQLHRGFPWIHLCCNWFWRQSIYRVSPSWHRWRLQRIKCIQKSYPPSSPLNTTYACRLLSANRNQTTPKNKRRRGCSSSSRRFLRLLFLSKPQPLSYKTVLSFSANWCCPCSELTMTPAESSSRKLLRARTTWWLRSPIWSNRALFFAPISSHHRLRHNRMGPLHLWSHIHLLLPNCCIILPHQQIGAAIHNQKIVYRCDRLSLRNPSTSLARILLCQ